MSQDRRSALVKRNHSRQKWIITGTFAGFAMVARINTVAFQGVDTLDIDVQVQIAGGLPAFTMAQRRKTIKASFCVYGGGKGMER